MRAAVLAILALVAMTSSAQARGFRAPKAPHAHRAAHASHALGASGGGRHRRSGVAEIGTLGPGAFHPVKRHKSFSYLDHEQHPPKDD